MYYYKHTTVQATLLRTVITYEYVPISSVLIKWRWEDTVGSFDGNQRHTYQGFVPYVMGERADIYIMAKSSTGDTIMSSILTDDNSYRLYPEFYAEFGLITPADIRVLLTYK